MNCDETRKQLPLYIESLLSDDERAALKEHLSGCQLCASELSDLEKAIDSIKGLQEVEPPPWLAQSVMERIRAEEEESKGGVLRRLFSPAQIKIPLQAAATILIAVGVVFIFKAFESDVQRVTETLPSYDTAKLAPEEDLDENKEQLIAKRDDSRIRAAAPAPAAGAMDADVAKPAPEKKAKALMQEPVRAPEPPPSSAFNMAETKERLDEAAPTTEDAADIGMSQTRASMAEKESAKHAEEKLKSGYYRAEGQAKYEYAAEAEEAPADLKDEAAPSRDRFARAVGGIEVQPISYEVTVDDVEKAGKEIEDIIKRMGGEVIKKTYKEDRIVFTARLDATKIAEFVKEIKKTAEVKEPEADVISEGIAVIEIDVSKKTEKQ